MPYLEEHSLRQSFAPASGLKNFWRNPDLKYVHRSRSRRHTVYSLTLQMLIVCAVAPFAFGAETGGAGHLTCPSLFHELLEKNLRPTSQEENAFDQIYRETLVRRKFDEIDPGHEGFDFFVERLRPHNRFGLSDAELAMLGMYTGHGYKVLNAALREGGIKLEELRPFIETMNSALQKLPNYVGVATRSSSWIPNSELVEHQVGNVVIYKGYTSASARGGAGKLRFTIHSKTGKQILKLSMNPVEDEVIFLPGTRFKVLKRTEFKWGWIEFELEEI